ncbi:CBS domain-containing protein [Actinoplanes sp. LDG1-06]|uniref:CBS domain-containing protein n=1 Tax=Paractinoplanes ovalisporus TaxID=2810368 RepID=A0ABS2A951_9ACTN|nr:CBS domain-containing protein [Actinoplanes ovalisporus]MBM2615786.1 CBS domain-containing protein [Actinoplanes ovalisporus]
MKTWTVDDVMTEAVVSVPPTATYRELVDLLIGRHFSAVPVVDDFQRVIGVVSETDLLRKIQYAGDDEPRLFERRRRRGERAKSRAGAATDLMSEPAVTVATGTPIAAAARTLDDERVKRLPVVDAAGRLVGIVTRGDLLKVHLRPDDEIRRDVLSVIFETVGAEVREGVVTLTGEVDRWSAADRAERLARQVPGAVRIVNRLTYDFDDSGIVGPGTIIAVA